MNMPKSEHNVYIFFIIYVPLCYNHRKIYKITYYWEIRTKTTKCIQKQTLCSRMSTRYIEDTACKQKTLKKINCDNLIIKIYFSYPIYKRTDASL